MLSAPILTRVHNAVCAVGILPVPLEEWQRRPKEHPLEVRGTGFLVRPDTVITNKHVLDAVLEEAKDHDIPQTQLFLSFIAPSRRPARIRTLRMVRRPHFPEGGAVDIALIEIKAAPEAHFQDIVPLDVAAATTVTVSEEVFICGYPYGNMLLEPRGKPYRFGPVVQQGYVSGLAPFAGTDAPQEILLDVRTADKMSGSPVVRSQNGDVIGIHHQAAIDTRAIVTTSFAIPLDKPRMTRWLEEFDRFLRDAQQLDGADPASQG